MKSFVEKRPWGQFEILCEEKDFKTKRITIEPDRQISYQSHAKRSEHWTIVRGRGEVILDDRVIAVQPGSHVFIPVAAKHRLRNTGTEALELIEVQTGSYLGEDDIVRYADDYGRAPDASSAG